MNETEFARFVCRHLDYGSGSLPDAVKDRLEKARIAALARQKGRGLSVAFAGVGLYTGLWPFAGRAFAGLACALVLTAILTYAHSQWHIAQLQAIDSAILTGDLPLEAYLDKDFSKWLDR